MQVGRVLSFPNYFASSAQLRAQPTAGHRSKMQAYKGTPPVGYEDEVYTLREERIALDRIIKCSL